MKIYTKTGDQGETGLLGGVRVSKSHCIIQVCGGLDETNCWLGLIRSQSLPQELDSIFECIQNDLFDLGSRVAAEPGDSDRIPDFELSRVDQLESWIDQFDAELEPLQAFILPGGSQVASQVHLARAVSRRSERELVGYVETLPDQALQIERIYLNRLSDLLFVLGRYVNQVQQHAETKWQPR